MAQPTYYDILSHAFTATEPPEFIPEQLAMLTEPFDADRHERLLPVPLPIQHLLASFMELEARHEDIDTQLDTTEDAAVLNALAEEHSIICPMRSEVMSLIKALINEAVNEVNEHCQNITITDDMHLAALIAAEESRIDLPPELLLGMLAALLGRRDARDSVLFGGIIIN